MADFLISDTHFGNAKYLEFEQTPFKTIEEKNNAMVHNCNTVVRRSDTLFILGDLLDDPAAAEWVANIVCRKVLIKGNHDIYADSFYRDACKIDEVYSYPILYKDFFVLSHKPPEFYNMMMPYAYIYGHVHNTEMYQTQTKRSACVCVERWNYAPVSFDELKKGFVL